MGLKVPQAQGEAASTPIARNVVLTLPEGLSISPGIVDGVRACNESGPEGINFEGPESEETGFEWGTAAGARSLSGCVGCGHGEGGNAVARRTDRRARVLARPLCGGAGQAPCTERDALNGNLYQLYLELGGHGALANTGVNIKVHLKTEANPATGQLTTVAEKTRSCRTANSKFI